MSAIDVPARRPANPLFSSGPTAKHPGWNLQNLQNAVLGRSHRCAPGKAKLRQAIDETREFLAVPADYRIAIVPASDTGAVEMALWSLLGARGIDCLAWETGLYQTLRCCRQHPVSRNLGHRCGWRR